jgi:hypothetical protein
MLKPFNDFLSEQRLEEILAKVRGKRSPVGDADLRDVIRDSLQQVGVNANSDDRLKNSLALALIFDSIIRFVVNRFKRFGIISPGPGLTELITDAVMDACPWARHRHVLLRSSQAVKLIADALRVHHGGPRVSQQQDSFK